MSRILVIDDDPDIRGLLSTYFQGHGHQVFVAEDGAHGIGIAAQRRPDVVILDLDMPVLNGHSTLHVMKGDPHMSAIPIVVLTSHDNTEMRDRLLRAGCAEFLGKPFELNQLSQAVTKSLKANEPTSAERI